MRTYLSGIVICLFLYFLAIGFAWGQVWQQQYDRILLDYENSEYDRVLQNGRACLLAAESEFGVETKAYAFTLKLLSSSAYHVGNYQLGIDYGLQELANMRTVVSENSSEYASSLNTLALNYQGIGQYDKSIQTYEQVAEITKILYGEKSYEFGQVLVSTAYVFSDAESYDNAALMFREALSIFIDLPEAGSDYLNALFELGNMFLASGNYSQGITAYSDLLSLLEDNQLTSEEMYGYALLGMGDCYKGLSNKSESETYYKRTVDFFEASGSTDNDAYHQAKSNLGGDVLALINAGATYQNNQQYDRAMESYTLALDEFERNPALDVLEKARLLDNLAILNYSLGNYTDAEDYSMECLAIFEERGEETEKYGDALITMGRIMMAMGYYADAEYRIRDAIALFENISGKRSDAYAASIESLASLQIKTGKYADAEPLLSEASEIRRSLSGSNNLDYAYSLSGLGALYQATGNYNRAENYFLNSYRIISGLTQSESREVAESFVNLGRLYFEKGSYLAADSLFQRSMAIYSSLYGGKSPQVAKVTWDLARVKHAIGEYSEAEPLYRESVRLLEETQGRNNPDYLISLNSLAYFYQTMGNFSTAQQLYKDILNITDRTSPQYATALQNLSSLYQLEGNYRMAEPLLVEALYLDSLIFGIDHPNYGISLQNLAALYQQMEQLEKSELLYIQALEIDRQKFGINHPSYARKLFNLAVLYQDMERYNDALPRFREAISIRKELLGENHPDYAYSLYGLAVLHQSMGNDDLARPLYDEVIANYMKQIKENFPTLSEKEKAAFYNKIRPILEDYRDFAIEYSETDPMIINELFSLQLNTKAILLNSSTKVRNRILRSGDFELIDLYNDWIDRKEQLVKYYTFTNSELEALEINLALLESQANDIEKELSARSEIFASEYDKKEITWMDVRGSLSQDEAVLEIIRIRKNLKNDSIIYAGLIVTSETKEHPQLVIIRNGIELEGREYKRYFNLIRFTVPNEASYNIYWRDFRDVFGNRNTVYISPDGIYNKLNLNTLWEPPSNEYLLDQVNIKLVSNLRELVEKEAAFASAVKNYAELLGFPDYQYDKYGDQRLMENSQPINNPNILFRNGIAELPGTKIEVENIDALLNKNRWETHTLLGEQALEENVKAVVNPKLLHIATHGFFLDDLQLSRRKAGDAGFIFEQAGQNPLLRAGLIFAGAENTLKSRSLGYNTDLEGEDGILTAYEAMNLNLDSTDLVVLSACETAEGEVQNGEGVYGLQRSFIVAGAKNLIMSLWKVNDAITQELMTLFYEKWLESSDKIDAFYEAQRMIKEKYPEPYKWGAFVIVGK